MRIQHKILAALLCAALFLLPGCGQKDGGDLLTVIREKGEIVIAMEGTWAPWGYHDGSGALVGYDVEVSQAIAEKLGVTPVFVEGEFNGLLAGLEARRYDIMVNGVDIDESRQEKYDFSIPYAYNRTAVIVRRDDSSSDRKSVV